MQSLGRFSINIGDIEISTTCATAQLRIRVGNRYFNEKLVFWNKTKLLGIQKIAQHVIVGGLLIFPKSEGERF